MAGKIVVLGEHRDGQLKKISWEAIGLGRKLSAELGKDLCLALVGSEIEGLAREVSGRSGLEVVVLANDNCRRYTPEAYCEVLEEFARTEHPCLLLLGHSYQTLSLIHI